MVPLMSYQRKKYQNMLFFISTHIHNRRRAAPSIRDTRDIHKTGAAIQVGGHSTGDRGVVPRVDGRGTGQQMQIAICCSRCTGRRQFTFTDSYPGGLD